MLHRVVRRILVILNTCSCPLRSSVLLATLLLIIAAIVPVCIATGTTGDIEIPAVDPATPSGICRTGSSSGGSATDAAAYCTQLGAIEFKVTVKPGVALPTTTVTYNSDNPPKGVVPPKTTTPAVTIRINNTSAIVPMKTTTAPVTLVTRKLTPFQTIATRVSVVAVTSTPCRDCGTTTVTTATKNLSMAGLAPPTSRVQYQVSPRPGLLDSLVNFIGSLFGKNGQEKQTGTWQSIYASANNFSAVRAQLTAKNNESLFIDMETDAGFENVFGNDGVGTYTWESPAINAEGVSSAVWQVSLLPFPDDRKYWNNPPGLLGMGIMTKDQHEFTVNFNEYIPQPEFVAERWQEKQPILELKKEELRQLEVQLAARQPFDPGAPQHSQVNQVLLNKIRAAGHAVDVKLANVQPYHSSGATLRALPPPNSTSSSLGIDPVAVKYKAESMKEALTLSLPTDRRTVYIRVALFDSTGNCTTFTNQLPVGVGKKSITLIGPWSGWKEVAGSAIPSNAEQVANPAATYFNGRIYLFGHTQPGNRLMMATIDNAGTFSGWSEVPGAPVTATPVSAATLRISEQYSPKYLYIVSKGTDQTGDMHLYTNRMDLQGSWAGWTIMPYSMLTETAPSLSGWVNTADHGLIMVAKEWGSNKNFYTNLTFLPGGDPAINNLQPQWVPWKEIPGAPSTSSAPAGVRFRYTRAGIPPYTSAYYGTFFIARSSTTANGFTAGHLYYTSVDDYTFTLGSSTTPTATAEEKPYVAKNTWSGWMEVPGNQNFMLTPSVAVIGDRLSIADKSSNNVVQYTSLDSQGEWAGWTILQKDYPSAFPPMITGEMAPAVIVPGTEETGRPFYLNTQRDPLLILSGHVNTGTIPSTTWTSCPLSGEFPSCSFYWKPGDTYFATVPQTSLLGALATGRTDGKRILWQFSRAPFNDTADEGRQYTINELARASPGVMASGLLPVAGMGTIPGQPGDIPQVQQFPIDIRVFLKDLNSTVPFYVRGILISPGDRPGEMNGYVTPSRSFIYTPSPEIHSCPKPYIHDEVILVPEVTIQEYRAIKYPAADAPCHVISSRGPIDGPFGALCPAVNTTNYVCSEDEGILDYIAGFFGSLIDLIESLVNFISRMWDSIKGFCVDLVAAALDCQDCKSIISGCIDVGLASIGVPPSLPNFADLQNMGTDYLAATIADGVGLPPDAVKPAVGLMNKAISDSASTGTTDLCGWKVDPAYQGHPEYIVVRLTNNHAVNTTPGNLRIRDTFTDSRGQPQSVFRTAQDSIPYPKLVPGQTVTIPIFLERTVTPQTIGGCQRKVNGQWQEWTCDDFAGNLNLDDWDIGYGQSHPLRATLSPETSIDIAALETELGMKYGGTMAGSTNINPLLTYGECPPGEFYVRYVYSGKISDSITNDPRQDWVK